MNSRRPEDFEDRFLDYKVYDHVSARKDHLVDEFLGPAKTELPLVRIYPQQSSTDTVLDYLEEWVKSDDVITNYSSCLPFVSFKQRNGSLVFCDYICIEYFRLYIIAPGKNRLNRYTYFELYYDNYILACLMDIPTFQKASG